MGGAAQQRYKTTAVDADVQLQAACVQLTRAGRNFFLSFGECQASQFFLLCNPTQLQSLTKLVSNTPRTISVSSAIGTEIVFLALRRSAKVLFENFN